MRCLPAWRRSWTGMYRLNWTERESPALAGTVIRRRLRIRSIQFHHIADDSYFSGSSSVTPRFHVPLRIVVIVECWPWSSRRSVGPSALVWRTFNLFPRRRQRTYHIQKSKTKFLPCNLVLHVLHWQRTDEIWTIKYVKLLFARSSSIFEPL